MLRERTRTAVFYIHLVRVNLAWERNDSFLILTTCSLAGGTAATFMSSLLVFIICGKYNQDKN
jgi:hypothetical protein